MQVLFFSFVYSFLISHISGVYNKYNFIILYGFHVRQYVTRIFSTIHIGIPDYDLFPESPRVLYQKYDYYQQRIAELEA